VEHANHSPLQLGIPLSP